MHLLRASHWYTEERPLHQRQSHLSGNSKDEPEPQLSVENEEEATCSSPKYKQPHIYSPGYEPRQILRDTSTLSKPRTCLSLR